MHIGLIGGIGPAATDYYYRHLIEKFSSRKKALELTIVHADTPTLLQNLEYNDVAAQVKIYKRLTQRLVSAGAECVVVTSVAGHFCIDAFKQESPLPVIDIIVEVDHAIKVRELARVGILGTRTVMETQFYSGISSAELISPTEGALNDVHSAYISMAASGDVTRDQRAVFDSNCEWLIREEKVEAIMLGGTDLALVYKEGQTKFPIVDCAAIHVESIVRYAIG
ncbi:MAG: aspartate/glutamate racemase family protein [Halioglobus sp.]